MSASHSNHEYGQLSYLDIEYCFCSTASSTIHASASESTDAADVFSDKSHNSSSTRDHTYESSYCSIFNLSSGGTFHNSIEDALYQRVVVGVCSFGLIGNVASLVVLIFQATHTAMGRIQRFACIGLTALAVSDSLFCLSVIPHCFVERDPFWVRINFSLFYAAYGEALINTFVMASTWLTVAMAVGRYLAICYPFRARELIGGTIAKRCIVAIYGLCILFNIPRFCWNDIRSVRCDNETFYFRWFGNFHQQNNPKLESAYFWLYFIFALGFPLTLLGVSSYFLVRKLRLTQKNRLLIGGGNSPIGMSGERSFTLTLICIAVFHILLVAPSEMLSFLKQRILGMDSELFNQEGVYNFLAAILNTLQAVNFSFNFLLYCAVNLSFRGLFVDMVRCRGVASSQQNGVVLQRMQLINDASINQAPEVLVNLSSSLPEEEVA